MKTMPNAPSNSQYTGVIAPADRSGRPDAGRTVENPAGNVGSVDTVAPAPPYTGRAPVPSVNESTFKWTRLSGPREKHSIDFFKEN